MYCVLCNKTAWRSNLKKKNTETNLAQRKTLANIYEYLQTLGK